MCAGDAIQWVSRWMRVMGFDDFMLLNINDMLKGIRIVNAQYPITQYRPWEKTKDTSTSTFDLKSGPW